MRKLLFVIVPVIAAGLLALPGEAQAAKKGGVIAYGDILIEVGELPKVEGVTDEIKKAPQFHGVQAGFKCKALVVLFAHMHKWGCQPVLVRGTTYWAPDEQPNAEVRKALEKVTAAIEKKYKPSDMKANAWVKHGRFGVVLLVIGLVAYGVMTNLKKGKKKEKKDKAEA